jgi:hypothetical protein
VTLGVKFDLSDEEGRKFFTDTLRFWTEQGEGEQVQECVQQLLREIDKLRARE